MKMLVRTYVLSGRRFHVTSNDPEEPETANRFVVDIWDEDRDEDTGTWLRVVGIFNTVGEAITAGKREYTSMGYSTFK